MSNRKIKNDIDTCQFCLRICNADFQCPCDNCTKQGHSERQNTRASNHSVGFDPDAVIAHLNNGDFMGALIECAKPLRTKRKL